MYVIICQSSLESLLNIYLMTLIFKAKGLAFSGGSIRQKTIRCSNPPLFKAYPRKPLIPAQRKNEPSAVLNEVTKSTKSPSVNLSKHIQETIEASFPHQMFSPVDICCRK